MTTRGLSSEIAQRQVAAVEVVADRWEAVLSEVKEIGPRWILDPGTMALDTALREIRAALALSSPSAPRLRAAVPHGPDQHLHGDWLIDNAKCPFEECDLRTPPGNPCDCDYWHSKHRFHCATNYPPGEATSQ